MPPSDHRLVRVTDSAGRVLSVRRPGVLQRLALHEAIGPENARNAAYLGWATLAAAVVAIDGAPCPPLAGRRALEAAVSLLDEHGLAAVAQALEGDTAMTDDDAAAPSPYDLAQERLEDGELMWRLSLVRNGFSLRDAFALAPDEPFVLDESWMLTFAIGLGLLDGRRYDWKARRWRQR